jgi:hypothetical protein
MNLLGDLTPAPKHLCVVRLSTSYWQSARGIHQRKDLTYLRRQCQGFNILEEEAANVGAPDAVANIINLDGCADGVYQVVICNAGIDFETGQVDSWDLKLIPYVLEK